MSCGVRGAADTWKYHRQSPFPAGGGAPDGALFNFVLDRVSKTQVIARGEMFIERDLIFVDLVEDETSLLLWIEEHIERLQPTLRSCDALALTAIRSRNCAVKEGFTRNSTSTTRGRMIPPPSALCHPSAHLESETT